MFKSVLRIFDAPRLCQKSNSTRARENRQIEYSSNLTISIDREGL